MEREADDGEPEAWLAGVKQFLRRHEEKMQAAGFGPLFSFPFLSEISSRDQGVGRLGCPLRPAGSVVHNFPLLNRFLG